MKVILVQDFCPLKTDEIARFPTGFRLNFWLIDSHTGREQLGERLCEWTFLRPSILFYVFFQNTEKTC